MTNTLTPQKIKAVEEGLTHYFPFEAGETTRTVFMNDIWSDLNGEYKWKGRDDYFTTLSEVTGIQNLKEIKKAAFILEDLKKSLTETPAPDYVSNTTLIGKDLEEKMRQAEIRNQQSRQSRENQTKTVVDFIKQNQERIDKAQLVQDKLKDKVVYAKIILPEPLPLDEIEKQDLSVLRETAQADEVTRQKLIDDLAKQIEAKLANVTEEQKVIIARTAAVEIVEKLAKPEKAYEAQIQSSILTAIHEDKEQVVSTVVQKDDELLIAAKNGSTLLELEHRNKDLIIRNITKNIFGSKLTLAIHGPEQYEVVLSENKVENQTAYQVNLADLNQNYIQELSRQNSVLTSVKDFGVDRTQSFFTGQARTYIAEKMANLPVGSVVKKAYSDPIIRSLLSRYGLAESVSWQASGQSRFIGLLMKVSPDTAGPIFSFAGRMTGIEIVTPMTSLTGGAVGATIAAQAAATYTSVAITGGVMAAEAFAGGAGGAAAGAAAGTAITPVIGTVIGAVVGAVGGKALSAGLSKLKIWWTNNKNSLGPAIAVGLGFGALALGGPMVGGIVLLGGLAATGTIGAFATGAFGVFGFIGRSVGIAIATPVIITILVIPPLVAFIMLVINNSAYVVPPSISTTGADNPYMLVTKTANPSKTTNPTNNKTTVAYTVEIRALKSPLTNLRLVDAECNVIKKNNAKINCPPEDIPEFEADLSISPTSPYSFTFFVNYDSGYGDALVFDTITIAADTIEESNIVTEGSASVCFGDCPQNCAKVEDFGDPWPTGLKNNANIALADISKYQGFTAKLCPNNEPVNLCYKPSQIKEGYYAWHVANSYGDNCDVYFNSKGLGSPSDASFIITHELTHHVQEINGRETTKYESSGGFTEVKSGGFCTYEDTAGSSTESMAEAAALYVNSTPSWSACAGNYSTKYPRNFSWAQKFMTQ